MTPLAIFLHSGRYDRVYQALNLTLTAASSGRSCYLFLFYGALAGFMDGSWDHPDSIGEPDGALASDAVLRRAFELSDTPVPSEILEMVRREEGRLTLCACSTSMRLLDLPPEELRSLGAAYADYTLRTFGWDKAARRYLDVIGEVVKAEAS